MVAELLSQRTPRVIVTLYKAHRGWVMTSLKMLSIGTNAYVCVFHIKILARWQHDKVVSILAAVLEDKCLKIIVACQEFKDGIFSTNTKLYVKSKKQTHF